MRETFTDVVVTVFPEPYKPWEYVSTRDELSAWLRKYWEKMDREKYSSDWSDRDRPWRKYTMTIDPADKSLKFEREIFEREIKANPAGSNVPFEDVKQPKIEGTFGEPASKL